MAKEIERKFLVLNDDWVLENIATCELIVQGYLSLDPNRIVRVRIKKDKAFITTKGLKEGLSAPEFEYEIPVTDAKEMLTNGMCIGNPITKIRRTILTQAGLKWEVDVFYKENYGLMMAEIELPTEDTVIELPSWIGTEVTYDPRYSNSELAINPYTEEA